MKKIFQMIFAAALMTWCCFFVAYAESSSDVELKRQLPRLVDAADVLTDSEKSDLLAKLDEISETYQFDVAVITIKKLPEDYRIKNYADNIYKYYGFGMGNNRDGCLLLIDAGEREWGISTSGYGMTVFTDAGIEYIGKRIEEAGLSEAEYDKALLQFTKLCDKFIKKAQTGKPYNAHNLPKRIVWAEGLIYPVLTALPFGLCFAEIFTRKLQKEKIKDNPYNYIENNFINITDNRDVFLFSQRTCTPQPSYRNREDDD